MNQESEFTIKAVFIFNPLAVPENKKPSEQEIQDAKLLCYHPQESHIEEKRNQTGMAEGIFQFYDTFNPDSITTDRSCQTIHLEYQTHIIYRLREDWFIFMTISHKQIQQIATIADEYFHADCHKFNFSHDKESYIAIIEHFIAQYDLFYHLAPPKLSEFITKWSACNSKNGSLIFSYFQTLSLRYAALDSQLFLKLQYLNTMLVQLEPSIQEIVVFYNGYFVYSSLPHKLALLLKEHYYGSGVPWNIDDKKIQRFTLPDNDQSAFMTFSNMKQGQLTPQWIYIPAKKQLFTYLDKQFLVLLFLSEDGTTKGLPQVNEALNKNVLKITQKLESLMDNGLRQDLVKFVYFNGMNLAYKISNNFNLGKLSPEQNRQLFVIYQKLNTTNTEILRSSGLWFIGSKIIDKRVILILPSTVSLSKLDEEVTKLTEQTFPQLFL